MLTMCFLLLLQYLARHCETWEYPSFINPPPRQQHGKPNIVNTQMSQLTYCLIVLSSIKTAWQEVKESSKFIKCQTMSKNTKNMTMISNSEVFHSIIKSNMEDFHTTKPWKTITHSKSSDYNMYLVTVQPIQPFVRIRNQIRDLNTD